MKLETYIGYKPFIKVLQSEKTGIPPGAKLMGSTEAAVLQAFQHKLNSDGWTFTIFTTLAESLLDLQSSTEENGTINNPNNSIRPEIFTSDATEIRKACDSTDPS